MEIITVAPGDTVFSISQKYGISAEKIIADNGLGYDGGLVVGQSLVLLFPKNEYITTSKESIRGISLETGITPGTIFRNNIDLGGTIFIDAQKSIVLSYENKPTLTKFIGGYAYDYISNDLLRTVTSYMTYLMPFTYGFNENGTLIAPDDTRLIDTAYFYGALPLMHLSTLTEYGNFSNELANKMLSNSNAVNILCENVLNNIINKGYYGVDIDFEFLLPEDKEKYVNFIEKITNLLNAHGYICVVALPPKTSDDQKGLLYEGVDYKALGEAANFAFIMTYEWGYRFGPPLAVAPVNSVNRVVDYTLSRIPNNKVILGISNYGYDWTLPYNKGDEAISISTVTAIETAKKYGAEIKFDTQAMSPYFNYTDTNGKNHIVWFEDAKSYAAKVEIIKKYDLAGGFIWDLMRENPQGYVTLNALIDIL